MLQKLFKGGNFSRAETICGNTVTTLFIIYHEHFFTSDICEAIHVTGDNSTSYSEGGLYLLSDERTSDAPNNPVWKTFTGNRFIFNDGTAEGWRISKKEDLTTGNYMCKGKHILIIFTIARLHSEYLCA